MKNLISILMSLFVAIIILPFLSSWIIEKRIENAIGKHIEDIENSSKKIIRDIENIQAEERFHIQRRVKNAGEYLDSKVPWIPEINDRAPEILVSYHTIEKFKNLGSNWPLATKEFYINDSDINWLNNLNDFNYWHPKPQAKGAVPNFEIIINSVKLYLLSSVESRSQKESLKKVSHFTNILLNTKNSDMMRMAIFLLRTELEFASVQGFDTLPIRPDSLNSFEKMFNIKKFFLNPHTPEKYLKRFFLESPRTTDTCVAVNSESYYFYFFDLLNSKSFRFERSHAFANDTWNRIKGHYKECLSSFDLENFIAKNKNIDNPRFTKLSFKFLPYVPFLRQAIVKLLASVTIKSTWQEKYHE